MFNSTLLGFAQFYHGERSSLHCCSVMSTLCDPWNAACQVSQFFTIFQNMLKLMSIESMMPFNHLVLCHPLLLLPSIFPSIRVFSNESVIHIRWPECIRWPTNKITQKYLPIKMTFKVLDILWVL